MSHNHRCCRPSPGAGHTASIHHALDLLIDQHHVLQTAGLQTAAAYANSACSSLRCAIQAATCVEDRDRCVIDDQGLGAVAGPRAFPGIDGAVAADLGLDLIASADARRLASDDGTASHLHLMLRLRAWVHQGCRARWSATTQTADLIIQVLRGGTALPSPDTPVSDDDRRAIENLLAGMGWQMS